jgi:hypothetical protein
VPTPATRNVVRKIAVANSAVDTPRNLRDSANTISAVSPAASATGKRSANAFSPNAASEIAFSQ